MAMYLGNKPVKAIMRSKNNLLNIFGRIAGNPGGSWDKNGKRKFDENKYYPGLTSTNYLIPENFLSGGISNGCITVQTRADNYGIAIPVKCKSNTKYSISFSRNEAYARVGVAFYTEAGVWIKGREGYDYPSNSFSFTTPENSYWIVFDFVPYPVSRKRIAVFTRIMLNEGDPLPYEPYNQLFTVPIKKCVGKNLFDISKLINTTVDGDYFKGADADKSFYNLRVTAGKTYTVTYTVNTGNDGLGSQLLLSVVTGKDNSYYGTGKRILLQMKGLGGEYSMTNKFTVPENVTWVSFSTIGHKFRADNFMINEGDTALPYEPYTEWYEY